MLLIEGILEDILELAVLQKRGIKGGFVLEAEDITGGLVAPTENLERITDIGATHDQGLNLAFDSEHIKVLTRGRYRSVVPNFKVLFPKVCF